MEVKAENNIPIWLTKLLSEYKIYKMSFSKYGKEYENLLLSNRQLSLNNKQILLRDAILTIIVSFILGAIISFTYMKISTKGGFSQNFVLTLFIIPTVVAIIVFLVGSNVARVFSLAGALMIIRFRSVPGDSKDISYVLFTTSSGLAVGVGLFGYGILFTASLCIMMFALKFVNFGANKTSKNC